MKTSYVNCCSIAAASLAILFATNASAGIIDDLASATILHDFQFNDASGTTIDAAANSANPLFLFDADSDTSDVVTNGAGQLDASLKNNTAFGTNYIDNIDITSGRVLGVMELTWDFDQTTFDPAQDEEIRITLINNPPRGSQVTAEVEIERNSLTELELKGAASGGDSLGPITTLSLTQSSTFIMVVDANLDTDTYSVFYSADAGATFDTLGTGAIDPTRGVAALRMVLNEDFVGDNVLIDRVYMAYIPEPSALLLTSFGATLIAMRRSKRS